MFEATEVVRGARVAVKVLRADRPSALQAFKREFRALTDLAHENLVAPPLTENGIVATPEPDNDANWLRMTSRRPAK